MGKLYISKSNYTVKSKKRQFTNGSSLYEKDFWVSSIMGNVDNIDFPGRNSRFAMERDVPSRKTRKRTYGEYYKLNPDGDTDYWCLDDMDASGIKSSTESCVYLNPNYESLLDFAYYGGCTELVESTIKKIILNFPAGLTVIDRKIHGLEDKGTEVLNPYELDITSEYANPGDDINSLRYFCLSSDKYEVLDGSGNLVGCTKEWHVEYVDKECFNVGELMATVSFGEIDGNEFIIYVYYGNSGKKYVTDNRWIGYRIMPIEEEIIGYRDRMDAFTNFLVDVSRAPYLNGRTGYDITIDYPHDTDRGVKTYKRTLYWTTYDGWMPVLDGADYNEFIGALLKLCTFYDENYYTDNLWNNMTHEAIKKMDFTFKRENSDEDKEDYNIGTDRMGGFIKSVGRFFDELKRYADGIKHTSNITYNGNNNVPDYLLTDKLEESGWDTCSAVKTLDSTAEVRGLFAGSSEMYDIAKANVAFLKNLKLNSARLFSKKGTRAGIEELLGLFGLKSYEFGRILYERNMGDDDELWEDLPEYEKKQYYDYRLNEYVGVIDENLTHSGGTSGVTTGVTPEWHTVNKPIPEEEYFAIEKLNLLSSEFAREDNSTDNLVGLPCKMIYLQSGDTVLKYIIPWFTENYVNGEPYFQMYGGWGKRNSKKIKNQETAIDRLISNDEFQIYEEDEKYIHIAEDIRSLHEILPSTVANGDVYYVYDISGIEPEVDESGYTVSTPSHYFVVTDRYSIIDDTGWQNITNEDIRQGRGYGMKILYLESIIDRNTSSGPHVGRGGYDAGQGYMDIYERLFGYGIDNGWFEYDGRDCDGNYIEGLENAGFRISVELDNAKTWFFTNKSEPGKFVPRLISKYEVGTDEETGLYRIDKGYEVSTEADSPTVGIGNSVYDSEMVPYNIENGKYGDDDEASAFSIINLKKISLILDGGVCMESGFEEYFDACIYPYVIQMVPSTALLEIEVFNESNESVAVTFASPAGISEDDDNIETYYDVKVGKYGVAYAEGKTYYAAWNQDKIKVSWSGTTAAGEEVTGSGYTMQFEDAAYTDSKYTKRIETPRGINETGVSVYREGRFILNGILYTIKVRQLKKPE